MTRPTAPTALRETQTRTRSPTVGSGPTAHTAHTASAVRMVSAAPLGTRAGAPAPAAPHGIPVPTPAAASPAARATRVRRSPR